MSDNFEFDDNDDVLLTAFCTPPNDNTSPGKRCKERDDENISVKRPKLSESTSPVIQFSHNLNKATTSLQNSPILKTTKRIFPGPAGILLDENQTDIFSQDTTSFFQDGPWKEMSKDFKISDSLHLFDKFNIDWIKKEATANKFANQKAPFLAGILLSLEVSEGHAQKSINITLKDMTGTIQGTILQNLYEEYATHFTLGSVLVLTQFGVLSCTCDKCDNHHLTITPKNLSAIYSGKDKIVIKELVSEEVLKEYYQKKSELELVDTCRKLVRQNSSSSPVFRANSSKCSYGINKNIKFQGLCSNRNILSPNIINTSTRTAENVVQKGSNTSESFHLPKVKTIGKSVSETTMVKEVQDLKSSANTNSSLSPAPKKLFSFTKVNTSPKINTLQETSCGSLGNCNIVTVMDSSPRNQNFRSINNCASGKKDNDESVKTGNSQLSVKVDKVEHEKIWKDLLENMDVNSLFEDDF